MKNQEVKLNLERLLKENLKVVKSRSVETFLDELLADPVTNYNPETGEISGSFYEEEIEALQNARGDSAVLNAFRKVGEFDFDNSEIIDAFKKDITTSLTEIACKIKSENRNFDNQIIFLENGFEPYAYFCGFGKGDYPILMEPSYIEYNFREEIYNGLGKVDYSIIFKDLVFLNELVVEREIDEQIAETNYYQSLQNAVKYKTYLLLHESFDQLGVDVFEGIEIEKPLYIYANEHDCEAMNIYVLE